MNLPFHASVIDGIIIGFFALQILWGAKLGFALATFSLAGEILGLVAGVLYAPSLGKLLDGQFHFVLQINGFLAQKTQIPAPVLASFAQTVFDGLIFLALFLAVSSGFFFLGKTIHRQIGKGLHLPTRPSDDHLFYDRILAQAEMDHRFAARHVPAGQHQLAHLQPQGALNLHRRSHPEPVRNAPL